MSLFDTLGIDWGSVRVGMAFGHSLTGLVVPFSQDLYWGNFWDVLKNQIETRQISHLVVGCPTNFTFGPTETSFKINNFVQELENKLKLWQADLEIAKQQTRDHFTKTNIFEGNKSFNQDQATQSISNYDDKNIASFSIKLSNSFNKKSASPFSNLKISVINERYSTQKSQNIQWDQLQTSKKSNKKNFHNQNKQQNKFQKTFQPTKTNLNHLAAAEILTSFFKQNPKS